MSKGPERAKERKNKPNPAVDDQPRGIGEAAMEGAAKGKSEADADPQPDARVTPPRDPDGDNDAP